MAKLPLIWNDHTVSKYCVLHGLQNVDDEYEIKEGISRLQGFPTDAYFEMDKQFKKQVALSDNLSNLDRMAVVSEKLKAFIEAKRPSQVEFLPVIIKNHKGQEIEERYHVMSPLAIVDCIDLKRSEIEWNELDPDAISDVLKLILVPEALDTELLLFRAKHLLARIFVRPDFAEEIRDAGFTGVDFIEIDEFIS